MPDKLFLTLKEDILINNTIPNEAYTQFDVKRGLRNTDGSGVLAGLSCISSVTGSKKEGAEIVPIDGKLSYRGSSIERLAKIPNTLGKRFEHAVFLLLVGREPTDYELERFMKLLTARRPLSTHLVEQLIRAIPSPNIMNKLQTVVSALYTEDTDAESADPYDNFVKSINLISKLPTIISYSYLAAFVKDAKFILPPAGMSIAEAFLYMLRQGDDVSPLESQILDLCFMLHAEHGGGNNSTFTTYVVSSSGSDLYGSITAAIGSLKGPLHGAANKMVMDMMADIKAHVSDWECEKEIKHYLKKIIERKAHDRSGKIYGLGHAVYTKSDPRAVILWKNAAALAKEKKRESEFKLYELIAKNAPSVFKSVKGSNKVIAPNVDFYSGFVYDCLGIPKEVYTPMFALARATGWCAHRIEELLSGKRVIRPAYKYIPQKKP